MDLAFKADNCILINNMSGITLKTYLFDIFFSG